MKRIASKKERRTHKKFTRLETLRVLTAMDSIKSFVTAHVEDAEEICDYVMMELETC